MKRTQVCDAEVGAFVGPWSDLKNALFWDAQKQKFYSILILKCFLGNLMLYSILGLFFKKAL